MSSSYKQALLLSLLVLLAWSYNVSLLAEEPFSISDCLLSISLWPKIYQLGENLTRIYGYKENSKIKEVNGSQ